MKIHREHEISWTYRKRIFPRSYLVTLTCMDTPYQPNGTGFDALDELDQVDWSRLEHCYGKGVVSLGPPDNASLGIVNLVFFNMGDCGDIDSLTPVRGMLDIRRLYLYESTKILEGDLSPLLELPNLI